MTFSLCAYLPENGAFGSVICSSSPAVAARCQWVRAGVGAVCTQNVTNPALGTVALDALALGHDAADALAVALASDRYPSYRQLVLVGADGGPAVSSGADTLGIHAEWAGEHAAAAGNLLASADVVTALCAGYLGSKAGSLEGRLLDGLEDALRAGGEDRPVRSAGLMVTADVPWPVTDLRIDWQDDPVAALRTLWQAWEPVKADYRARAVNPADAPPF
jgi:uncharacterized Ntn-hydrolase superfamily protein